MLFYFFCLTFQKRREIFEGFLFQMELVFSLEKIVRSEIVAEKWVERVCSFTVISEYSNIFFF